MAILYLFIALIVMIAANTTAGVILAKKQGIYDEKKLRDSVREKLILYFLLIIMTVVCTAAVGISAKVKEFEFLTAIILNAPIVSVLLFFIIIELRSGLKNLENLGVPIPNILKQATNTVEKL